jgi:DNA-binding beta-propeller fold protein YncE
MNQRTIKAFLTAAAAGVLAAGLAATIVSAGPAQRLSNLHGTVWLANRGANTIAGFDATTGEAVDVVTMAAGSQPGDLALANGKLYVAEEMGPAPAIAIVDPAGIAPIHRIPMAAGSRPHHVHASPDGDLVAVGLYGTDMVAVVDTATETLLGTWDTNPDPNATAGRAHAGVFSRDGSTLYVASDTTGEVIAMDPRNGFIRWRLGVPAAHELAVRDGKSLYVSRRTANRLAVIDLEQRTWTDVLQLTLPDTLRLSANRKLLTIGLRTTPAQVAVVDTETLAVDLVPIGPAADLTTVAGHQWTSPGGRYTVASFEGGSRPGFAVIDHRAGNTVVGAIEYPTRPHGVEFIPADEDAAD